LATSLASRLDDVVYRAVATPASDERAREGRQHDIAFVLLHHNIAAGTPAQRVLQRFGLPPLMLTPLLDLRANFTDATSAGAEAYARQITQDHPELDARQAAQDSVLAVGEFTSTLLATK
jgi:hypothetical protein